MIAAIHQPNYLPWLGYFAKLQACEVFVFHDAAVFSKRAVTKRTRIREAKGSEDTKWLSIPVRKHSVHTPIANIEIDNSVDWRSAHLRSIQNTYFSAPFFAEIYPTLSKAIKSTVPMDRLADVNIELINVIATHLDLNPRFIHSSELLSSQREVPLDGDPGSPHAVNLELLRAVNATTYLSGTGARAYQDDDQFAEAGIRLIYQDIGHWLTDNAYDQGTSRFVAGLSIVDALMHLGKQNTRDLISEYLRTILPELTQ